MRPLIIYDSMAGADADKGAYTAEADVDQDRTINFFQMELHPFPGHPAPQGQPDQCRLTAECILIRSLCTYFLQNAGIVFGEAS